MSTSLFAVRLKSSDPIALTIDMSSVAERSLALSPASYSTPDAGSPCAAVPQPLLRRLHRVGRACGLLTLALGVTGLAGWLFDQPLWRSLLKSGSEMKFNTALAIASLGVSLVLGGTLRRGLRYAATACAGFVALIAGVTLLEYVFRTDFGIDERVFRDTNPLGTTHAGRMAWHSALTLLCLSLGALLVNHRRVSAAQALAVAAVLFPVQALIGYVYSTMAMLGMSAQTGYMAVSTAVAFVAASFAVLLRAPDRGLMATLTASTQSSSVFRHLLPILIFVPLLLGWLTLHVAGGAHRTPQYNVATVATFTTVLLAGLAWRYAFRLNSAEGALRRNEANLRDFMENASIGIHWVGADGTILWANKSETALLGYTPQEYIGRNIAEFHAEQPVINEMLACLRRGETLNNVEARLRCKDGSIRHVLISSNALFENGGFVHTRCFTRDITERKQAEEALRESESRLRAMFGQAAVGIALVDRDGRVLEVNPRLCQILRRGSKDLCRATIEDLTHPDDWVCNKGMLADVADGRKSEFTIEKRYARGDGSWVWVKVAISPIRDAEGGVDRLLAVIEDIEARKVAEEAKAKLAAIVQHSDDAIISKDLSSIITSWNRGAEHLFGYTAQEVIGQPITILIPSDRRDEEPAILNRIRRGQVVDHFETIRRRKDGTLLNISLTVSPIRDEQGQIIGVSKIARNITERKKTEAQLAKAQAELLQHAAGLEKIVEQRTARLRETIGELESYSYSISHDMRAPLRAMQAYAQVLLTDYGALLEPPGKRYLNRIITSANRLDKLIQDVLSYSRISRADVHLESINMDRLVADIIDEYPAVRAAEIDLVQPLGSVVAAEALLTQAVSNLLSNAVKFVAVGQMPQIKIWSEMPAPEPGAPAMVKLFIQDRGIGIAPEDQQRIFGIFARVHSEKEYEGTGIGLSIVKKAVERMGGEVSLVSELGKGSTFCMRLLKA